MYTERSLDVAIRQCKGKPNWEIIEVLNLIYIQATAWHKNAKLLNSREIFRKADFKSLVSTEVTAL